MSTAVAFLGPEGTFAATAADRVAGGRPRLALPTIPDVLDAVRDGRAGAGVVPIENSLEGAVDLTLDALVFAPPGVFVRGETALAIRMALLGVAGTTLPALREVRSHPVALGQCRIWLRARLPSAELVSTSSTAEAARQVAQLGDPAVAALGPGAVAAGGGLAMLADDLADPPGSTTRFAVLGRTMAARTGADRTMLVVFLGADRPGLLLRVLEEFAVRGINLVKIESRPARTGLDEFCIVLDCEGHPQDARVGEALRSVHRHVARLRVLGAWPRGHAAVNNPGPADDDRAYAAAAGWFADLLGRVDRVEAAVADDDVRPL